MNPRSFQAVASLLLAVLLAGNCAAPEDAEFDHDSLEKVEDFSEKLANDLLAMSVSLRDRDFESAAGFFANRVRAAPLPQGPPTLVPLKRWIQKGEWELTSEVAEIGQQDFVADLEAFFGRFTELEDVRFKVKSAQFEEHDGVHGAAHLKFFLVGRDEQGRREWIRGLADIEATTPGEDPWRITAFRVTEMASQVSTEDLFTEVALAAGVAEVFPAFGVGKNQGFVSHGAAVADVNNDGLLDIAASGVERNYLYLNLGDGRFRDASEELLVAYAPTGSGALFLDFDNDGDSDLFFAAVGRQILLENRLVPDGQVRFHDVSDRAGVDRDAVGFSAVSADVNGDGFPDIYVCSYNRYGTVMPNSWFHATNGTPNLLFVNNGDGTFTESAADRGVADGRWSYAAGFLDIDEDGDQDLYVANDFGENALYRNDGGRFTDAAAEFGIVDPGFGMGVSFGDFDNDGDLDLHVTNMSSTAGNRILSLLYPEEHETRQTLGKQAAGNSLYENTGDGGFTDVTSMIGGLSGGWAFGGGFVDFDNDGWADLYTPNGFISGKTMKDT